MSADTDAIHHVDRLWPDPATGIELDDAMADFTAPTATGRPGVAINMVTSIDGRAQLAGTAEGLGTRADRRLMRLYRAGFDGVGSGAGTLRATGVWLRVGNDLAERRRLAGRPPNPLGVVIAGADALPSDARWFDGDEPRVVFVGSDNPMHEAPPGTELIRSPGSRPSPRFVLDRLGERGIRSFLLEGGPRVNAAFLADGLIDEVYWTIGAHVLGTDALPMIAPAAAGAAARAPRPASLVSVLRHGDELFLRYRFDSRG